MNIPPIVVALGILFFWGVAASVAGWMVSSGNSVLGWIIGVISSIAGISIFLYINKLEGEKSKAIKAEKERMQ